MKPLAQRVTAITSELRRLGSYEELMEQINQSDVTQPEPRPCACGHSVEDHQGDDGSGAGSECSVWDCECEFYSGEEELANQRSIMSARADKVNHTIVIPPPKEDLSS
jgi:hypothetical protein